MLQFVVKGGTVALLAEAERIAGPIERPPLRLEPCPPRLRREHRRVPRRLRAALAPLRPDRPGPAADATRSPRRSTWRFIFGGYALAENSAILLGWTVAAAAGVERADRVAGDLNFFYLMTQMVVAIEDVSVRRACGWR